MRGPSCGQSGDPISALPCPIADPFAAADQTYAAISQFLGSEEACQVTHSDLEYTRNHASHYADHSVPKVALAAAR